MSHMTGARFACAGDTDWQWGSAGRKVAQTEIIHNVIGIIIVKLRVDLGKPVIDIFLDEFGSKRFPLELAAIHCAACIAGFAITTAARKLEQCIFVRSEPQKHIAIPFIPF